MRFGICKACGGIGTQTCNRCGAIVCIKCNSPQGCSICKGTFQMKK
ncbi:MAG: hypothetical protein KJ697_02695 [Nanoarchaeota archaeon]|nr:hypothetical protein [Nanoarchaeota archaeon]